MEQDFRLLAKGYLEALQRIRDATKCDEYKLRRIAVEELEDAQFRLKHGGSLRGRKY